MDRSPSEVLDEFLAWVEECQQDYHSAKSIIAEEELKEQDFWHLLEFTAKCEERSKIATIIHESRLRRRHYKNEMEILEPLVMLLRKEPTKTVIKAFKTASQTLKMKEEHFASPAKEYKPRSYAYEEISKELNGKGSDNNDNT